ncbi:MAG TPA: hypothetical protein VMD30_08485 [Tepidisphaeraceae bacterium]|nr:hypothetical protein [Tepidisphaeraceae bacterium]
MKVAFRWLLLVFTIGGGFTGVVLTTELMFQPQNAMNLALLGCMTALYAFTVVAGLLFADHPRRIWPLIVAWIMQVPWISSPVIAYGFGEGLRLTVAVADSKLTWGLRFGTDFQFFLFQDRPVAIGLNLVALTFVILLFMAKHAQRRVSCANRNVRLLRQIEMSGFH